MQNRRARRPGLLVYSALALVPAVYAAPLQAQADNPRLRLEYFELQRAFPYDRVPAGSLQRARAQVDRRWGAFLRSQADAATLGVPAWIELGPGNIDGRDAGRLVAIAIDPRDTDVIYVGGAQGGVWKTIDGGQTWTPLTDRECSLAMGALALDPVNPDIVYAGTGELHFSQDSYYGCGILRSLDGGATWTQLGATLFDTGTGGARVSKIIIDPASAGSASTTTLFAATSFGLFRSTNSGEDWTLLLPGVVTDLVASPQDFSTMYAAIGIPQTSSENGVFRTTNGGADWEKLAGGFPTANVGRIALAIAPSFPAVLYAAVQNGFDNGGADGAMLGIWRTGNGGSAWTEVAGNVSCNTQCWYDLVLAVHPGDPQLVYFGGVPLYRSTNGGASFASISNSIHVDQHAIVFDPHDPSTMYVGNDGGIFRSTNGGNTWTSLNSNLGITQFYAGISSHPRVLNAVLGGTQDNGTLQFAGLPSWNRVVGADGGYTAIDHLRGETAWAETQWTPNSGFAGPRRRDGNGGFIRKVNGIATGERALFIPPLVMDPTNPDVLYFGTVRVYRTVDRGELWTALSAPLSPGDGRVSAIASARSDPLTIYAGTSDGRVHVSRDGGASWPLRNTGLPERFVTDIAVRDDNALDAVITVSGFNTAHVFRTVDGGVSWQSINGNLPDMPVNAALHSPYLGDRILIGTDLGVYVTEDGGSTWNPVGLGLPNSAVFDLTFNPVTGRVIAATHGRGMFAFTPALAEQVTASQDLLAFDAVGDTVRLAADVVDGAGQPVPDVAVFWHSLDPDVATVTPDGLVHSRVNGATGIVAAVAGRSDTTHVDVQQIIATLTGLADSADAVVGENAAFPAAALDRLGSPIPDAELEWTSSNPAVLSVDGSGNFMAHAVGTTVVTARKDALVDSTHVVVAPAAVTTVTVSAAGPPVVFAQPEARMTLLRLVFRVDGIEAVDIVQLGFEISGRDANATLLIVEDLDGDAIADPLERVLGERNAQLVPDEMRRTTLVPSGLRVPAGDSIVALAVLRLSGGQPNGSEFRMRYLPQDTRSFNARSAFPDRLVLPAPVESDVVLTTVLQPGELMSISENPVFSARIVINFAEPPRMAGVFTVAGRRVIDLRPRLEDLTVEWDLRNEEGARIVPGVYLLVADVAGRRFTEKLIVVRPEAEDRTAAASAGSG